MDPFTDHQTNILVHTLYSTSILNLLGSFFTICTYLLFKQARNYGTSLIFCLALSDFFTAIGNTYFFVFLVHRKENVWCMVQGSIMLFGLCSSIMWAFVIGLNLFLALNKNLDLEDIRSKRFIFHIIAWGYGIIVCIITISKSKFFLVFPHNDFSWCFIPLNYRMMLFIPDAIVYFSLIIIYIINWNKLRGTNNAAAKELSRKMSIYLITYIALNTFAIVNQLYEFATHTSVFFLFEGHFLTQPLQGFLNAIAYGWNEPLFMDQYKVFFRKCFHLKTPVNTAERLRLTSMIDYDVID